MLAKVEVFYQLPEFEVLLHITGVQSEGYEML